MAVSLGKNTGDYIASFAVVMYLIPIENSNEVEDPLFDTAGVSDAKIPCSSLSSV